MRRVLVTGGASGIGAACVRRFQSDGCSVAVLDRDERALAASPAEFGTTCDVSRRAIRSPPPSTRRPRRSAGSTSSSPRRASPRAGRSRTPSRGEWDRVLAVNLRGVYLTGRAAIPHLRAAGGGAIVNIASQLGLVAAAGAAAYCASKGAVISLTRAMAIDHGPEGIRVNCVCPGPTDTPLLEPYFGGGGRPRGRAAGPTRRCSCTRASSRPRRSPVPSPTSPTPGSSSTMGAALVVDGGYMIR